MRELSGVEVSSAHSRLVPLIVLPEGGGGVGQASVGTLAHPTLTPTMLPPEGGMDYGNDRTMKRRKKHVVKVSATLELTGSVFV